ncbi:MAG TPA: PH domain-containing protein [Thermoflexales bacterium]|jgi:hypothetical protein|nr:PH domain-containing protein [Thermoflexales bacterium]HQX12455.1 PH domain-containing protein [Thermoflexales bacterium]HQY27080.1 PH domain-containing protein [Thermoflexales bacterium]HQZ55356.1 PH domain-containing protein [Thermoflexales bacterium]HRA55463.1 PH domain-containing protein [Thermoflexales bacterium]
MSDTPKPNNPISRFLSDEQDPGAAAQVFEKVSQLLTAGEEIAYIAVEKPLVSLSPDSVVLTNKRFIVYQPKLFGRVEFEDYIWRDLHSAELVEGVINSRFLVQTTAGLPLTVENLPKVQARKIYAFAQQMEEFVREERRVREMEEKRAAAGGINIGAAGAAAAASQAAMQPPPPAKEDPVQILGKLKQMLDQGLITADEYNAKKKDLIAKM